MKRAVRAIIIKGDIRQGIKDAALLTMHRNKFGEEYDTLIGGGVEMHESLEQALQREIAEETGVQVAHPRLVYIERAERMYGVQYIYLCEYVAGDPTLSAESEEAKISALGKNIFQPRWLRLDSLSDAPFVSVGIKKRILQAVERGGVWPTEPEIFEHTQTSF